MSSVLTPCRCANYRRTPGRIMLCHSRDDHPSRPRSRTPRPAWSAGQQPALAGQLQPLRARPLGQLLHQLLIDSLGSIDTGLAGFHTGLLTPVTTASYVSGVQQAGHGKEDADLFRVRVDGDALPVAVGEKAARGNGFDQWRAVAPQLLRCLQSSRGSTGPTASLTFRRCRVSERLDCAGEGCVEIVDPPSGAEHDDAALNRSEN